MKPQSVLCWAQTVLLDSSKKWIIVYKDLTQMNAKGANIREFNLCSMRFKFLYSHIG